MFEHSRKKFIWSAGFMLLTLVALWLAANFITRLRLQAQSGSCPAANKIDATLTGGGRWQICWEARDQEGIVLHDIFYTTPTGVTRKVLRQAGLAQIQVSRDDGSAPTPVLTQLGLGGNHLLTLAAADCDGGALLAQNGQNLLCQRSGARGYGYKYYTVAKPSYSMTLYSVSSVNDAGVGDKSYIVQWEFMDNGIIAFAVGETGSLTQFGSDAQYGWPVGGDSANPIALGYTNNYFWRLDFDLGDNGGNEMVEEFAVNPAVSNTQRATSVTRLTSEAARPLDPATKRSWRIRDASLTNSDGHAISYHLEPMNISYRYEGPVSEAWNQNDFFVTRYNECERFATQNSPANGCGASLADFVNGESIDSQDLVVWYRVGFHRLPRAEDAPYLQTHWDGFTIYPRDWTAQNTR
ncbi:MAG: hypothetical protein R2911_00060 [Caldilineaceae bacterium]